MLRRDFDRSWITVLFLALFWSCTLALKVEDSMVPQVLLSAVLVWSGRLIYPFMAMGWALGSAATRGFTLRA
jgi:hypothetical protein